MTAVQLPLPAPETAPQRRGRPRQYATAAERQRAYRARKAAATVATVPSVAELADARRRAERAEQRAAAAEAAVGELRAELATARDTMRALQGAARRVIGRGRLAAEVAASDEVGELHRRLDEADRATAVAVEDGRRAFDAVKAREQLWRSRAVAAEARLALLEQEA